jgi:hypothetical protein
LNHGELVAQLSKGLSHNADALPHVDLKSVLFPSKRMKKLVSIYAHVIKFSIRAVDWYKMGKIEHILNAIFRPYALRFKDLMEDIAISARQLDQLALSSAMAEQRDMYVTQIESHKLLHEMRGLIEGKLFEI